MNASNKVLVVDDNAHMRRGLLRILSGFDCVFFEAGTGEEALALIEQHLFQVVFLDIRLPLGVTGIDVFRQAKEIRPELGNVIILTGWLDDAVRAEALQLGAYAWLDKAPLDERKVIELFKRASIKE